MPTGNTNFSAAQASTLNTWLNKKFADTVFEGLPLFAWLKSHGRIIEADPGPLLVEPVMFDTNNTNHWMGSGFDEIDLRPVEGLSAAQFPWKWIAGSVVMSELDQALNTGPNAMINLWKTKVDQETMSLQTKFDQDLYKDGTADPNAITGLDAIVANSGTYGNISRTGNTFWQSYVDTTGGKLSEDLIRTTFNKATRQGIQKPDLILTTLAEYEAYQRMVLPAYRTTSVEMADLGFQHAAWMGVPIVWSDNCPAGTMYFINSDFLALRPLRGYNFKWTDRRQPTKQLVDAMIVRWIGAMTSNNPRFHAKLTGLTD